MFRLLGQFVVRCWPFLLSGWIVLLAVIWLKAPTWDDVVEDGEFAFLPKDCPSRLGEELFKQAWDDSLASRVVIVVRRKRPESGLLEKDKSFIDEVLKPRIEEIAEEFGGLAHDAEESSDELIISRVRTFSDKSIGRLLVSEDNRASLVVVELTTEFLNRKNAPVIERIERLIGKDLHRERKIPPGLELATSGEATVGRDMMRASAESAEATEFWTIVFIVVLLIIIYRAPLLALIPLLTVFLAVNVSLGTLAVLESAGFLKWVSEVLNSIVELMGLQFTFGFGLFSGIEVYVTVLSYGAGVDYCLFLIARYKEELDQGVGLDEAIAKTLAKVGAALTASAGTVMCGIGMMVFAEFGKFQQAGVAIATSLFVVLCAAMTFTPTVLRLVGRWAFWPRIPSEQLSATAGWISATSLVGRLIEQNALQSAWRRLGEQLLARPGTILAISIALLSPFAVVGVLCHNALSYGLLSELPPHNPSVTGARAVQAHFPAGSAGPVTILLKNKNVDFKTEAGIQIIDNLTNELKQQQQTLKLSDIRNISHPFGITVTANETAASEIEVPKKPTVIERMKDRISRDRIARHYVSHKHELNGHVTRIDLIFREDPFSRNSIFQFERLIEAIKESKELPENSEVFAIGATASIRDLKTVTDSDQIRIDLLVLGSVFLILIAVLRKPAVSLYLIVSVFFCYLVTLGVTFAVFWYLDPVGDPAGFAGLDWKVPMFLFCILIAVGEDYNIFLMTRIEEEQARHGLVEGVIVALQKTGNIIMSCGIIMAGTFSSLLAGSLVGMHQLGFSLAFGVLLATFVVMPILVPAYLVLLFSGRLGVLGKFLGAGDYLISKSSHSR